MHRARSSDLKFKVECVHFGSRFTEVGFDLLQVRSILQPLRRPADAVVVPSVEILSVVTPFMRQRSDRQIVVRDDDKPASYIDRSTSDPVMTVFRTIVRTSRTPLIDVHDCWRRRIFERVRNDSGQIQRRESAHSQKIVHKLLSQRVSSPSTYSAFVSADAAVPTHDR